jgi:hypothetical protein
MPAGDASGDAGSAAATAYADHVAGGAPREVFSPRRRSVVDQVRMYALEGPPIWHLVTIGAGDLGFELTLRLPRGDDELPTWAVDCLVSLVAYVRNRGHRFSAGDQVDLRGPIKLDSASAITAAAIVADPTLGTRRKVDFLQVVGLTADELELCRSWRTAAVVGLLRTRDPLLTTVLDRASLFDDPRLRDAAEAGVAAEGSSLDELNVATLSWRKRGRRVVVTLGAGAATALGPALRRKLNRSGAAFAVAGDGRVLRFVVAAAPSWRLDADEVTVEMPLDGVEALAALFSGRVGTGSLPALKGLRFSVIA